MKNELLLAALGLSAVTACDVKSEGAAEPTQPKTDTHAAAAHAKVPDLNQLLKAVAEKPTPNKLSMGAMCYDMAMPPDRIEYVCPACGAKNLHATQCAGWRAPVLSIGAYRAYAHKLKQLGLDIKLDESCLCSACKKEGAKALAVEVTYKDKKTRKELRDIDDLRKLLAFVGGKLVWKGGQDEEHPLKPELPRIRELLGLNPE